VVAGQGVRVVVVVTILMPVMLELQAILHMQGMDFQIILFFIEVQGHTGAEEEAVVGVLDFAT
jgi:hypothetical protein